MITDMMIDIETLIIKEAVMLTIMVITTDILIDMVIFIIIFTLIMIADTHITID